MIEKISIQNNKGKMIAAVAHYPSVSTERLAILCPGYLDSKDYDHLVRLAEVLSAHGYTAVRFDPTGTGESEGDIADYLTSQYLEDVKSVFEHMLKKRQYDHVLLAGHSRGGMISILYAARDPRISNVVAIMPPSPEAEKGEKYIDWKNIGYRVSMRDVPNSKEKREYRVPYEHVIDNAKFNVLEEVKNVHVQIMFIAGELDQIVHPADVKAIFDFANQPREYVLMKAVSHGYRRNIEEISRINDMILKTII